MPILPGLLVNLPSANVVLSAVGSTSGPVWDELSPIMWWILGPTIVAGIIYLIFVLLNKVFWGHR